MTAALSILFAGTPQFSVPALEALVNSRHRIVAVYTQPDRPAGRGRQLTMSAVKEAALRHRLAIEQPASLRDAAVLERLRSWSADLMVVVAYGLLLPEPVLHAPRFGCVNIHASLLPRWRGAAPIQRAILAGDRTSGVTIMQMDAGLDTGPILLERTLAIGVHETAASLHDRLSELGATALIEALEAIAAGTAAPRAQPQQGACYAAKIRKEEALIDWSKTTAEIDAQVRAFNPWPVAETQWNAKQLRVWEALPIERAAPAPAGTVIGTSAGGIDVATADGALRLTRIQIAGRKAVTASEFLNAHSLDGAVLRS